MATPNGMTTYLSHKLLDHSLGTAAYTPPVAIYVALFSSAPSDSGGGTELSGNGYARAAATFSESTLAKTENSADVTFGPATANWNEVTHYALFDSDSGGNMLWWGALNYPKTVLDGEEGKFLAGYLDIDMSSTDAMTTYCANAMLNLVFRGTAWSRGTSGAYLSLHTANPGEAGTGAEVSTSGTGYEREVIVFGTAGAVTTDTAIQNGEVSFEIALAPWGTITHAAIWDASTAGNCLFYGDVADRVIGVSDLYQLPDNSIQVTLD